MLENQINANSLPQTFPQTFVVYNFQKKLRYFIVLTAR